MKILTIGDIVSKQGCEYLRSTLPALKRELEADIVIANGENSAVGNGILPQSAEYILDCGVDLITLGNHTFGRREICPYLDDNRYILRPANLAPSLPGHGWGVFETNAGPVAVANLIGRCAMDFTPDNPFRVVDKILKDVGTIPVLIDFHAEATSEKLAMAYYLDGKASALWGTHTHVPTADEQILPNGLGYQTDLGMTGPYHSVLGVRIEQSIAMFRGDLTEYFKTAPGDCAVSGAVFEIERGGKCVSVERVWKEYKVR